MEALSEETWLGAFAALWLIYFWLFGMQRASLLTSRNAGIEWRGGGELLLPSWYKITWLVMLIYWGLLIALAIYWDWRWAAGLGIGGFLLNSVLPIPYSIYKGIFKRRVDQLRNQHGYEAVRVLDEMLANSPF